MYLGHSLKIQNQINKSYDTINFITFFTTAKINRLWLMYNKIKVSYGHSESDVVLVTNLNNYGKNCEIYWVCSYCVGFKMKIYV